MDIQGIDDHCANSDFRSIFRVAMPDKSPAQISSNLEPYKKLGMLRWEDGKEHPLPQDFADMLGFRELAYKVDSVYNTLPDKKSILILCDNYGKQGPSIIIRSIT
jgi:hypothetical protein